MHLRIEGDCLQSGSIDNAKKIQDDFFDTMTPIINDRDPTTKEMIFSDDGTYKINATWHVNKEFANNFISEYYEKTNPDWIEEVPENELYLSAKYEWKYDSICIALNSSKNLLPKDETNQNFNTTGTYNSLEIVPLNIEFLIAHNSALAINPGGAENSIYYYGIDFNPTIEYFSELKNHPILISNEILLSIVPAFDKELARRIKNQANIVETVSQIENNGSDSDE